MNSTIQAYQISKHYIYIYLLINNHWVFIYFYLFLNIVEVGSFYYGEDHPMKPFRIKMAHQLIIGYELYRKMNVYVGILYIDIIII
jgi:hypothetical protein